jgi:uncharacterized protein (TIGR02271 family)
MANQTNDRVVVGFFDEYSKAQQASRELENQAIPGSAIRIESNMRTGAAGYGGAERRESDEGGFTGWWHRTFGSDDKDDDRGNYSEAVRRGGSVLSVSVPESHVDTVAGILNDSGAVDIDRRSQQWRQEGYTGYDPNLRLYTNEEVVRERERYLKNENATRGENAAAIPVVDEALEVGKRRVQRGGVRVYSRVVDRPVEEKITLREEHVKVERRPANRDISEAELGRLKDQTIEVAEMTEEPVVSKRARVKEEVVVGKETTERTETIRGNVRSTDVRVEKLDGGRAESDAADDPAYQYGYRSASDGTYRGRLWAESESSLRDDYQRRYPGKTWDEVKGSVRRGWEKATGQR